MLYIKHFLQGIRAPHNARLVHSIYVETSLFEEISMHAVRLKFKHGDSSNRR
jgi:hypothetical protein